LPAFSLRRSLTKYKITTNEWKWSYRIKHTTQHVSKKNILAYCVWMFKHWILSFISSPVRRNLYDYDHHHHQKKLLKWAKKTLISRSPSLLFVLTIHQFPERKEKKFKTIIFQVFFSVLFLFILKWKITKKRQRFRDGRHIPLSTNTLNSPHTIYKKWQEKRKLN
jgi:hypothetical protein